ncbi:MAG: O-antigen ligase family protein [Lachnospiraceae bacterium]|nr:O-antigen ligase family protein [Lachnospiraceae bacterium]
MNTIKINGRKIHLVNTFLTICFMSIFFCGATLVSYITRRTMYIVGIISIFFLLKIKKIRVFQTEKLIASGIVLGFFLIANYWFSIDKASTIYYLILFWVCISFIVFPYSKELLHMIIDTSSVICLVEALSIIFSLVIPNFIVRYFSFLYDAARVNNIMKELSEGYYSGLLGEKAVAAVALNIGIIILFSQYFSGQKVNKQWGFKLVIYIIALLLTGKRTLCLIPLFVFIILFLLSGVKNKAVKIVSIGITIAIGIFLIFELIPSTTFVLERFIGKNGTTVLSGREDLWSYAWKMFLRYAFMGGGYGAYNTYLNAATDAWDGGNWLYDAHNCFLQIMGECGAVGSLIFLYVFITGIKEVKELYQNKSVEREDRIIVTFSFGIQVLLLIYALTGNVFYSVDQLYLYFFSLSCVVTMNRDILLQEKQTEKLSERSLIAKHARYQYNNPRI